MAAPRSRNVAEICLLFLIKNLIGKEFVVASFVKYFFFFERREEKESFERTKLKLIFRIVRDAEEDTIISRYDKSIVSVKMHFDEEIEIYIDGK